MILNNLAGNFKTQRELCGRSDCTFVPWSIIRNRMLSRAISIERIIDSKQDGCVPSPPITPRHTRGGFMEEEVDGKLECDLGHAWKTYKAFSSKTFNILPSDDQKAQDQTKNQILQTSNTSLCKKNTPVSWRSMYMFDRTISVRISQSVKKCFEHIRTRSYKVSNTSIGVVQDLTGYFTIEVNK